MSGPVSALKGHEHALERILGYSGPFVVDQKKRVAAFAADSAAGASGIFDRVLQDIGDEPAKSDGIGVNLNGDRLRESDISAGISPIVDRGLDKGDEIEALPLDSFLSPNESKDAADHRIHALDVLHDAISMLGRRIFGAEAQAGERRAQVVGDGGEQLGPLLDRAPDPALHFSEGARGLAYFTWAGG
jgi:hypothetical protein